MNKPHLTIRTTLLVIIGILNILIAVLVGNGVYDSWVNFRHAQSLRHGADIIDDLYEASKNLSLERGASLSVIYATPETADFLKEDIAKSRLDADAALSHAFAALKDVKTLDIKSKHDELQKLRVELDATLNEKIEKRNSAIADRIFKTSTSLVQEINVFILGYRQAWQNVGPEVSRRMMFKYFVWELAEAAGEEYAIIGRMIAESKRPTSRQQEQLMTMRGRIQYGWEILRKYAVRDELARKLLPVMKEAETHYFLTFEQTSGLFYGLQPASATTAYPISIEMWLGMAAQAVDSLLVLQDEVLKETRRHVSLMEKKAKMDILGSTLILVIAVGLSLYCWNIVVFRVARPINAMVNALYKATREEDYTMPKIYNRHDEVGKLGRVLEVFQDNTRKIKQSNEELERFAYIAAHDLKSPLRAVDNISQWLEEDLAEILPEKDKKYMEELRSRVRHMDKLLDDTLEYARAGAKMERKSNEIVSGKTLMNQIAALLDFPREFTLKTGRSLADLQLEKMPLQQVLYNLVNNALKHHDKKNGTIEVDCEEIEGVYIFSVRDDGPGIDRKYHQKIFEMFQTLQPRDKSKGRGMGLAMVRKIVMTNGGVITVHSEPGKGAEFRFTWPKLQPETIPGGNNADVRSRYA